MANVSTKSEDAVEAQLRAVDCRWLLALYALIPISLFLVAVDTLALDGVLLRQHLPAAPERWAFWTVIFGLPHIVASLLTMADREYLSHYRYKLLPPLLAFAAIACAGQFGPQPVGQRALFVFLAFYTVYHVLAQQLGLTLMMMDAPPSPVFRLWKWLAVLTGFAIYINVYGKTYLGEVMLGPVSVYQVTTLVAVGLCAAVIVLAIRLTGDARHRIGTWYLWGNVALLGSALLINEIGYTLFVILVPRVIHDVTAYIIYVTHDGNRNRTRPVNLLYRLTRFSRLPPLLLLPAVSILIAYALTTHQHLPLVNVAVLTISFLHYYYESFIWRGASPHRQYVPFRR